jgi:hypothetical protein
MTDNSNEFSQCKIFLLQLKLNEGKTYPQKTNESEF